MYEPSKPSEATLFVVGLVLVALFFAWRFYRSLPDPVTDREEPPPDDYASPFEPDREQAVGEGEGGEGVSG